DRPDARGRCLDVNFVTKIGHRKRARGAGNLLMRRLGGRCWFRVFECLIDELKELGAVENFNEWGALGVGGNDPYGGGVVVADSMTVRVISIDCGGKLALRIHRTQ